MIELTDLCVSYNGVAALDGVSVRIGAGAVGLLGPNGAGKSTLIRTLLGFNRAKSGSIAIFGLAMPAHAIQVRHRIGYMPEKEVSSPKVSAVSFLTYCGRIFGMSRVDALERAHEVLNYVKIGNSRYRMMESYSTGMLQRVKLAQAILHDPKLLLLDEPTNGLDPDGRIEILELVKDIAARPEVSVVVSSHLLPDVQHVCEQVVMINKGRVVRSGAISDLTTPRPDCFEVRLRDNDEAFATAARESGCECTLLHPSNTWLVRCTGDDGEQRIFAAARQGNAQIRHFRPARHTLEDVFLQAVGRR